jgi:DNA-binding LytR/AlgR family response regulator
MVRGTTWRQALWGERRDLGDRRPGYLPRSRREWMVLIVLIAGAIGLFAIVGALTTLSDRPGTAPWKVWTWAITSAATALPCTLICLLAVRRASPGEWGWPRSVLMHGVAALAYAVLHVAGFVVLRNLVYWAMGETYGWGPLIEDFPYELRKDLLTYTANVSLFWLVGEHQRQSRPFRAQAVFDIYEGSRLIRVGTEEILAVCSAGNYVEFRLKDGRRPLMRATLSAIHRRLEPMGLIRTHRSWLINITQVTGLEPDGSGDWTVYAGELRAPLSRRFPEALARLKA